MSFISETSTKDATGKVRELYEQTEKNEGFIPNYVKLFSHRPQVLYKWDELLGSISENIDFRRYELATIATARGLRSSYCMLAHGNALLKNDFTPEQLQAVATDFKTADLLPVEVEIMSFAEQIAKDSASIDAVDIQKLRDHGLSDTEIFDIAATAAARCFFSKLLDALGTEPDSVYQKLDEGLRQSLTVGRDISTTELEHFE